MTWKCPKCGREFSKTNQDHYCIKPRTIDEYIAAQEESLRPRLEQLRAIIHEAIPDAEERISWSMPTFWKGKNLIHFASFRKHIGLYPGDDATAAFAEKLAGFEVSKGTIRLPHHQALPEKLIADVAKWCYASYTKQEKQLVKSRSAKEQKMKDGFITPPNHVNSEAKKLFGNTGQIIDGSIAYINLKGGGPTEKHTHEHNHLFIVVKGEAKVLLGEEEAIIPENEAYLVEGKTPHSVWSNQDEETIMIGISVL